MDIFFQVHKDLPREGPGSDGSTRKAFGLLKGLPLNPRILDVGCGPGMQTLELARLSGGQIVAVDTHQPFLDDLACRAQQAGLASHIITVNQSMSALDFPDASFDAIWSEGAIYIMGFETGLRGWKRLLKPGGCLAVSELTWLRPAAPEEITAYWGREYPPMKSLDENLAIIQSAGYRDLGHFVQPPSDWWDAYYLPIEKRVAALRRQYAKDPAAQAQLAEHQREVDMYRKYADWYSYVFYAMQSV